MENLITEGRYDKVTTELSREIVNAIKKGVKRYQTKITLFSRTIIDISVYFHYDDNTSVDISAGTYINPKDIRSYYKNKRIVFHVNVPKTESLKMGKMPEIVAEVKNVVRHEIEHVTQAKFTDRERKGFFSSKRGFYSDEAAARGKGITYLQYLLEPYEVEAYVRGLYKKAKTLKQPLNVLLDDWWDYLSEYTDLTDDEIELVKDKWVAYAKKHLSQEPFIRKGDKLVPSRWYGYNEETVNESIGFKPSYMNPDINVIINFDAPDANQNLSSILEEILKRKSVKINSISVGGGKNVSCKLDVNLFNERDIQYLIDDLHRELMVKHDVRIQDVIHYIK
jgi:hypothetical protein